MKAAVQYEVGKPLVVDEVQLEDPQDDEIKVKIVACGVCHSDLTFMKGDMPAPMPIVMGHEGAGIVEKVGARVTSVTGSSSRCASRRTSTAHCSFTRSPRTSRRPPSPSPRRTASARSSMSPPRCSAGRSAATRFQPPIMCCAS